MSNKTVIAQIWPWDQPRPASTPASRRTRAIIQFTVALLAAGILLWIHHYRMATVVLAIGVIVLFSGLFLPKVFAALERAGQMLGYAAGTALTWILLVPVYWLVFTPGRLLLLVLRRDPMRRAFPTQIPSYWIPRPPVKDVKQYTKQF